jgi:LysR family nod box-dependent transcriptional activator
MDLAKLDLNLLVVLDALIKERNVTRAAHRIGSSQAATSRALHQLRVYFQDELLIRSGRDYRLTSVAESLTQPLEEILGLIEDTVTGYAEFNPGNTRRVFRIAASDASLILVVQPFVERLVREAPGIGLSIRALTAHQTVVALEAGVIDLGIWRESTVPLESALLYHDRWVGVVWKGCEAVGDRLTLDQYKTMPRIGRDWQAQDWTGLLVDRLQEPDGTSSVRIGTETLTQQFLLLRGTNLLTIAYERYAKRMADFADIRVVELPFENAEANEVMYWHRRHSADPAHSWLRAALTESAARLSG